MKHNMGGMDRALRVLAAVVVAVLYFTGTISGAIAIVLAVIAALFLVTSAAGVCPAYIPLGFSTRKR